MVETKIESARVLILYRCTASIYMSVLSQSHIPYELIALIIQNLLSYVYMMCTLYTYYVQQTMFCFDNCPATTTWKYIVVDTILFLNTTYFVWKKYLHQGKKSITQSQLIDYWKHDFVLKTCFLVVTCHLLTFVVLSK